MKAIRITIIAVFVVILVLPLMFFNFKPDSISEIDNRKLTENPFSAEGDLTNNIENYVNDRIGFRDSMISAYTILNDQLFGKMVHPSYSYGKDGYVFGNGITTSNNFGAFHIAFADMVKSIQDYCESRGVPFLFVFNPAKPAIYQDKLATGVNYNREWVDLFFSELDKRNVQYLDNTQTLAQLTASGTHGYNQKYDANHWNATGAFYGTQKMLELLNARMPSVHINKLSEFTFSETLKTSLAVSNFPIHEYVPAVSGHMSCEILTSIYADELDRHPSFQDFGYYVNTQRKEAGAPKALVFQGSYMNKYGGKYMRNSFGEYIYVHDYQNIINFPYYFNIFQPDCVVFEVAEYTFSNKYFSQNDMLSIDYNPAFSSLEDTEYSTIWIDDDSLIVDKGNALTVITWKTDTSYKYVWLDAGNIYDMTAIEGGYQVAVDTKQLELIEPNMEIIVVTTK